jgi:ketosteroid isomerase-like protein
MAFSRLKTSRVAAGVVLALFIAGSASAADTDKDAVLAAHAKFYAALNQMFTGDLTPMKDVWSHANDVTYMGPTGNYERGWATVLKDWEGQAALKLGGKVMPSEINAVVEPTLAVITNYEVGENTNAQGKVERVQLRATNTFRKESGLWKMVGHQTDKLPYLAK